MKYLPLDVNEPTNNHFNMFESNLGKQIFHSTLMIDRNGG
jgi:hypothetical protein